MAAIIFTFAAGNGSVRGEGWDLGYQGFGSGLEAWTAVTADGFALKPGTELFVSGGYWSAEVVRG